MLKKSAVFSLILIIIFVFSLKSSSQIQSAFLGITDGIKSTYWDVYASVENMMSRYMGQKETIVELQQSLKQHEMDAVMVNHLRSEMEQMLHSLGAKVENSEKLLPVQALSYVKLGSYYRVWIDFDFVASGKVYGLIQNQFAAGIVVEENGRALGLLNGDPKCSYGVYIGNSKAPGIVKGKGPQEHIIVDYIPAWMRISVGDEVVTSGVDGIFLKNIKVGEVVRLEQSQGYKIATVKPYADVLHPGYFWLVEQE